MTVHMQKCELLGSIKRIFTTVFREREFRHVVLELSGETGTGGKVVSKSLRTFVRISIKQAFCLVFTSLSRILLSSFLLTS